VFGTIKWDPFKCISEDADIYNYLLKRSLQLDKVFKFVDEGMSEQLKNAREGLRRKMVPLRLMSIPEHNLLHYELFIVLLASVPL